MSYKTILVHIDSGKHCPARVEVAARLASQHDAHLIGLHAPTSVEPPKDIRIKGWQAIIESQKRDDVMQAALAETAFNKAVAVANPTSAEWRSSLKNAAEAVSLHARYADLLVLGQRDPAEDYGLEHDFVERVALSCGRPALVIPYAGRFVTIGKRILVAWDRGREATRALTDAIPLLRLADEVKVIAISPKEDGHGALPGADIGLYLARHGVNIEVKAEYGEVLDVGNELLSRAADFGTDLIVMGAYGHSRLRELIMGGATRTIIDSMTVPVLLSH